MSEMRPAHEDEAEFRKRQAAALAKDGEGCRAQDSPTGMSIEIEQTRCKNSRKGDGFAKALCAIKHGFVGFILGVVATIIVIYTAFDIGRNHELAQGDEYDLVVLQEKIEQCNELATASYLYTDAELFKEGIDIPFLTGKEFILKYSGSIKAGVNLDDVEIERDGQGVVLVKMPPSYIISHELDENSFEVLREHETIFSSIKIEDVQGFRAKQKERMEERARMSGVLEEAEENARSSIRSILEVSLPEGTSIEFEQQQKSE